MSKNKVKLRICDIDCTVTSEDDVAYVRALGEKIDKAITGVMQKNERISLSMAAIITAMTYCDEANKIRENKLIPDDVLSQQLHDSNRKLHEENLRLRNLLASSKTREEILEDFEKCVLSEIPSKVEIPAEDTVFCCVDGKWSYIPAPQKAETPKTKAGQNTPAPTTNAPTTVIQANSLEDLFEHIPEEHTPEKPAPIIEEKPKTSPAKKAVKPNPEPKRFVEPDEAPAYAPKRKSKSNEVEIGFYTQSKSPFEPNLPSNDSFMDFFEKK